MLAQQESIAELLTMYEADRSAAEQQWRHLAGQGNGQQQLQGVQQEHHQGKACLKKDR